MNKKAIFKEIMNRYNSSKVTLGSLLNEYGCTLRDYENWYAEYLRNEMEKAAIERKKREEEEIQLFIPITHKANFIEKMQHERYDRFKGNDLSFKERLNIALYGRID